MATPLTNICPECGLSNPKGHRYCGRCGTPIRGGASRPLTAIMFLLGFLFVFGGVLAARYAASAINTSLFEGPRRTPIPYVAKTSTPTPIGFALATLSPSPTVLPSPSPTPTQIARPTPTKTPTAIPAPPSPTPQRTPAASPSPMPQTTPVVHIVAAGETMFSIARRYGVTLDALAKANGIDDPTRIFAGQKLVIPQSTTL